MKWTIEHLLIPFLFLILATVVTARNWRRIRNWARFRDLPATTDSHFAVLIADLDGDSDGSQTRHVVRSIGATPGLEVLRVGRCLKIDDVGSVADNIAKAVRVGRKWLEEKNADVLIWGEVIEANRSLQLGILASHSSEVLSLQGSESEDGTSYMLNSSCELPENFSADLSEVLVGFVKVVLGRKEHAAVQDLKNLLLPTTHKLKHLIENPPNNLQRRNLSKIRTAYGTAMSVLGEQLGEAPLLQESVREFRLALDELDARSEQRQCAITQTIWGAPFKF